MTDRTIIAGHDVFEAQRARKIAALGDKPLYDSEALCRFQQTEARHCIVEAEIVKSFYGYTLRYASGLQNWGLIAGCRNGELDGSYEDAVQAAQDWQSADPERRYVTAMGIPEIAAVAAE